MEQAKTAVANAVFEYQASEEMVALRKSFIDEGFKEDAQTFTYIAATTRLDWDLAYLGEHLIDQKAAWHDKWRATHPLADEHPVFNPAAGPAPPSTESHAIPLPPSEVHPEQVIEDDPEPAVIADENDKSVR